MKTVEEYFQIGFFTKTHGLKGQMQAHITHRDFAYIKEFNAIFLDINQAKVPFFINEFNQTKTDSAIVGLEDIDHIDKARDLIKKELFLPKKYLPKKPKGSFSWFDVEHYSVEDASYGALGNILKVSEMPQQFLAHIVYKDKDAMFPLHENFIASIDKKTKTIRTHLPDGLLDVYLD